MTRDPLLRSAIPDAIDAILVGGPAHGQRLWINPHTGDWILAGGRNSRTAKTYTRAPGLDLLFVPDAERGQTLEVYTAPTVRQCQITRVIDKRSFETYHAGPDALIEVNKGRMKRDAVDFVMQEGATPVTRGMWTKRTKRDGSVTLELLWLADATVIGRPHEDWVKGIEAVGEALARHAEFQARRKALQSGNPMSEALERYGL